MKTIRICVISFMLLSILSCNSDKVVFQNYKVFNKNQWHADSVVKFSFLNTDSLSQHEIELKIRHTVDYEYRNLFLFYQNDIKTDTLEVLLADKRGKWYVKGIGDIREVSVIVERQKFNNKKEIKYVLEQAMRYGKKEKIIRLHNLNSIGLRIIKKNK